LLVEVGLASTGREAGRLVKEGGVRIDGKPAGEERELAEDEIDGRVFQVGKRHFVRVRLPGAV
jgi:tyrosyl-tRNA synthetase